MKIPWFAPVLIVVFASLGSETRVASALTERVPQESIRIKVSASPLNAMIDVDGQRFTNPAVIEKARDRRVHSVTVSAPGYLTSTTVVSFQSDVEVFVALTHVENAAADGNPRSALSPFALDDRVSLDLRDPWQDALTPPTATVGWTGEPLAREERSLARRVILDLQDPWVGDPTISPTSGVLPSSVRVRFLRPRVALDLADPWAR